MVFFMYYYDLSPFFILDFAKSFRAFLSVSVAKTIFLSLHTMCSGIMFLFLSGPGRMLEMIKHLKGNISHWDYLFFAGGRKWKLGKHLKG